MDYEEIDDLVEELTVPNQGTFISKLEHIFSEFMGFEKGMRRLDTSFTLQQLAIYLEKLAEQFMPRELATRRRAIPGYLVNRGRPNLVMCPRVDQVAVALSIYAMSFEQPLPTNDECLFCSNETSAEEVENFLRIALKSNGECIYTLIGIQELKYDTILQVKLPQLYRSINLTKISIFLFVRSKNSF